MSESSDISKSPAQEAYDFYGEDLFYQILDMHLLFGYVDSTPDYFVMGKPVPHTIAYDDMIDISKTYPIEDCDAWCVYFYAGDMSKIIERIPFYLPYVVFERKGNTKIYLLEKLKHSISKRYGIKAKATPATSTSTSTSIGLSDNC
jgi:hypothetical protein